MSKRGPDYRRLTVELPTSEAGAVALLLGNMPVVHNLSIQTVAYEPDVTLGAEELFTLVEDSNVEKLVPAVQRPHIRAFAASAPEWTRSGAAERLISGIWRTPRDFDIEDDHISLQKRHYMHRTLLRDSGRRVFAIRAERIAELYGHVNAGRLDFMGVGATTTDFLGALSEAVQARLAERSRS